MSETITIQGEGAPPTHAFILQAPDSKMLVSIKMDGTVEFGESYSVEPAARLLWETLASYLPRVPKPNGLIVDFESVTNFGAPGEYVTAVVSFDAKREGRGTSRHRASAVAYALEDLAKQVKEQGYP